MSKRYLTFVMGLLCIGTGAWAQDQGGASTAAADDVRENRLRDEQIAIKPAAGAIVFQDVQGNTESRLAAGFNLEMNAMRLIDQSLDMWYIGPSTGLIYSHTGNSTANFFGADPAAGSGGQGANMFIIPANVKAGYHFTENLRASVHGGGNVIYRSIASAANLGDGSEAGTSLWKVYPNVGIDFDVAVGRNVTIAIRPDLTIAPNSDLFTGTLGVGIALG